MRLFAGKRTAFQRRRADQEPQGGFNLGSGPGGFCARLARMNRRLFLACLIVAPSAGRGQPVPGSRIVAATLYDRYEPEAFAKLLASGRPFIVHVHAEWCSACAMQEARLKTFLIDPAVRALPFVRVDFDRDREFLQQFRISAQSTLMAFRGGKEVARSVGETGVGGLKEIIRAAINQAL